MESISCPDTPYSTCSAAVDLQDRGDGTDSKQVSINRRKLIEHIKEIRDSKLTKKKQISGSVAPCCHKGGIIYKEGNAV